MSLTVYNVSQKKSNNKLLREKRDKGCRKKKEGPVDKVVNGNRGGKTKNYKKNQGGKFKQMVG